MDTFSLMKKVKRIHIWNSTPKSSVSVGRIFPTSPLNSTHRQCRSGRKKVLSPRSTIWSDAFELVERKKITRRKSEDGTCSQTLKKKVSGWTSTSKPQVPKCRI